MTRPTLLGRGRQGRAWGLAEALGDPRLESPVEPAGCIQLILAHLRCVHDLKQRKNSGKCVAHVQRIDASRMGKKLATSFQVWKPQQSLPDAVGLCVSPIKAPGGIALPQPRDDLSRFEARGPGRSAPRKPRWSELGNAEHGRFSQIRSTRGAITKLS